MTTLRNSILICLVFFMVVSCTKNYDYPNDLEDHSDDIENPVNDEYQIWKERVMPIVEGCTTHYDKAKAIFDWECANIAYDVSYSIYKAEECWNQRKGVCQAYSELFVKLAAHCDLEAVVISGKCRTLSHMDGDGDHAWVKVNTEKGWILIDPTWGAGYVSGGEFTFYYKAYWFDVDPALMIFTHFPDNYYDQRLQNPVTNEQFRSLPNVDPKVAFAGWNGHEVLGYFLNYLGESAPTFYLGFTESLGKFELVQVPFNGKMKVGQTYTLKIRSLAIEEGVSIGSWETNHYLVDWEQEGDLFTFVYRPETECEFHIAVGNNGIMKYDVTN
jgi:hypothetical protein